jgi:hypothetical protein
MANFWDVASRGLVEVGPTSERVPAACIVRATNSAGSYQTTRYDLPEDSHLKCELGVSLVTPPWPPDAEGSSENTEQALAGV